MDVQIGPWTEMTEDRSDQGPKWMHTHLTLAPQCKDIITKSENNIIKEGLFAFLATIDRKI